MWKGLPQQRGVAVLWGHWYSSTQGQLTGQLQGQQQPQSVVLCGVGIATKEQHIECPQPLLQIMYISSSHRAQAVLTCRRGLLGTMSGL